MFEGRLSWLDVGCGDGALVMTAAEFGIDAVGLDSRKETVEKVKFLGYKAIEGDFLKASISNAYDVLSMADVLEHLPYPPAALQKAHGMLKPQGLLFVSCSNLDCVVASHGRYPVQSLLDRDGTLPQLQPATPHGTATAVRLQTSELRR